MNSVSRRNFIKGGAAFAGVAAVGFPQLFGFSRVFAQGEGDDPQTILNLACTAETFACTHYYNAIMSADELGLTETEINWLKAFLDSELQHKLFLEANGAVALATEFYVPENLFTNRKLFVETSNTAENWFVAAYLAATRRFAELGEPLLAATASQVSGVEAEHQALIRLMGGLQPSFQVLKEALFWNTSEVVPFFQPFLEGADGFVGPAPFPGADEIATLVGDQGVEAGVPFIQLDGQGTIAMSSSVDATEEAAVTGVCMVSGDNANVRSTPDTNAEVTGSLTMDTPVEVTGQTMGADGMTWYQVSNGWVRADAITVTGDCTVVPMVTL